MYTSVYLFVLLTQNIDTTLPKKYLTLVAKLYNYTCPRPNTSWSASDILSYVILSVCQICMVSSGLLHPL